MLAFLNISKLIVLYLVPFVFQKLLQAQGFEISAALIQVFGFILGPCLAFAQGMFALNPDAQGGIFGTVLVQNLWIYVFLLMAQATVYMVLTIAVENHRSNKETQKAKPKEEGANSYAPETFSEELEEDLRRLLSPNNQDTIKVTELRKVYEDGTVAVEDLSFGVEKGQIFGLLGPNGAGKSTTFNIITQLISRTSGQIELNGRSVDQEDQFEIYRDCGVCPQFDPVWELLTVKEHLKIYGQIKGMSGAELQENIDYYLDVLNIRPHQDKLTYQLSGGNKRRLCVAMAFIGAPNLLFMDEPSTGLDPQARHHLWNTIKQTISMRNSSILLTTHSMPEAEALCNKIGMRHMNNIR